MRALSTKLLIFHAPAHTELTEPIQGLKEETEMTRKPPYYRLHIDLLRVSSALCLR